MAHVIPGAQSGNPFAWSEIMARQQGYQATDANNRAAAKEDAIFGAELGRQNALAEIPLNAQNAENLARIEARYRPATTTTTSSNSTPSDLPPGARVIPEFQWEQMDDEARRQWMPLPGYTNNRGQSYFVPRPEGTPVVIDPGADAAAEILGGTTTQTGAPAPGAASISRNLNAGGYGVQIGPGGVVQLVAPDGTVYTTQRNEE